MLNLIKMTSCLKLARFDKPVGIFLLLWPTLWGLWIANHGKPPMSLVIIFCLGTVLMRAAGCVINDMADRRFDGFVKRTAQRPLVSGALSLKEASYFLSFLLALAGLLLLFLNTFCMILAVFGAFLTLIYPFCKRLIQIPQAVLGFAFSWGILMAFAASVGTLPPISFALLIICYCWILSYDTAYAMADKEDDLKIGIKSMAIFLGDYDKTVIHGLQLFISFAWIGVAVNQNFSWFFYLFYLLATLLFVYQYFLIRSRNPEQCFQAFLNNQWYGLIMFLAVVFS
jgi:4-hydroxybenzoate polyprenyltransferase